MNVLKSYLGKESLFTKNLGVTELASLNNKIASYETSAKSTNASHLLSTHASFFGISQTNPEEAKQGYEDLKGEISKQVRDNVLDKNDADKLLFKVTESQTELNIKGILKEVKDIKDITPEIQKEIIGAIESSELTDLRKKELLSNLTVTTGKLMAERQAAMEKDSFNYFFKNDPSFAAAAKESSTNPISANNYINKAKATYEQVGLSRADQKFATSADSKKLESISKFIDAGQYDAARLATEEIITNYGSNSRLIFSDDSNINKDLVLLGHISGEEDNKKLLRTKLFKTIVNKKDIISKFADYNSGNSIGFNSSFQEELRKSEFIDSLKSINGRDSYALKNASDISNMIELRVKEELIANNSTDVEKYYNKVEKEVLDGMNYVDSYSVRAFGSSHTTKKQLEDFGKYFTPHMLKNNKFDAVKIFNLDPNMWNNNALSRNAVFFSSPGMNGVQLMLEEGESKRILKDKNDKPIIIKFEDLPKILKPEERKNIENENRKRLSFLYEGLEVPKK
jgi:hypothetical protein